MPDTKDFRTIDEQIEGLEKRGLQFKNKKKAVDILKKYNYFDVINGFESILLKRCKFRFIGSPIPLATDQCFRL